MIPTVPYLHPEIWKGQGISLQIQNGLNLSIGPNEQPPDLKARNSKSDESFGNNIKKRKFGEMNNLGAGLDDSQKHPDMREIEKQLPFMRY
jgi:hypothetical protein